MSDQDLIDIKRLAELQFSWKEISFMLGLNVQEFSRRLDNENDEVYKAYQGGKMEMEMKVRKSIFTLANAGSSPAQAMAQKLIEQRRVEEKV